MGNKQSHEGVEIASGVHGSVVRKNDRVVKTSRFYISPSAEYFNELRFYAFVETLEAAQKTRFSRITSSSIVVDDPNAATEITAEYKGVPIGAAHADMKYEYLAQLLEIVKLLEEKGAVHADIHPGNVLVNNGRVALIDYGQTYLQGDAKYEHHVAQHTMMSQVVSGMLNLVGTHEAIKHIRDYEYTSWSDQWKMITQEHPDIASRVRAFLNTLKVDVLDSNSSSGFTDLAEATMDNMLRMYAPEAHQRLYKLDTYVQPWFELADAKYFYIYFDDIDHLIKHFRAKQGKDAK